MKLTFREKYSYGIGAFGKDLVYAFVATYLMMFFTDEVGISSVFVGGLFFVSRFWDAINDPIMGKIVDNTNTKWGKFRPWLLIGTLINAVVLIFLFINPAKFLSGKMVYVYCSAAYILWGMTYTIMDIPYWSMIPSFTSDSSERDKMSVIPRVFATIGGSTVNTFGLMLISFLGIGNNSIGYFRLGVGIAIIFVISTLITVFNVKERNIVENQEKITLKGVFEILFKNDQLLVIIGSVIIYQIALFLVAGFALYFFKYAIQNESLYAVFTGLSTIAQVCALMIFPKLVSKLSRKIVYILACLLPVIGFTSMLFISSLSTSSVLLCIAGVIYNLGFAFSSASTTVMLCDAVDYGEYKVGKRSESIIFSMQTFIVKFATAFSGLIVGIGLNIINYVPNTVQSAQTIIGMKVIMFVIPSLLMLACLGLYLKFYKLNGEFKDHVLNEIEKSTQSIEWNATSAEKDGFADFMLKEIYEQPTAIRETIGARINLESSCEFDELKFTKEYLSSLNRIYIVACGTAMHAGLTGKNSIEKLCRIPVEVDIASEFRYRDPIIDEKTLCIFLSQSGETADTIAALKLSKEKGAKTIAIANVIGSSITREADYSIYTHAGPEIAVASTKAYTSQVVLFSLLALYFAQTLEISNSDVDDLRKEVLELPKKIEEVLKSADTIKEFGHRIYQEKDVFFLGRGIDEAVAREASLKLKEISYIHADSYPAGELKHGPIALIENGITVISIMTDPKLVEKTVSNIQEVITRGAKTLVITNQDIDEKLFDTVIHIPETSTLISPVLSVIPTQLLAYYISKEKGLDVDKPRNLAKSVTVE